MKTGLLAILLLLGIGGINKIAERNARTKAAAEAFREKRYAQAVQNYEYLVYEADDKNPRLMLNLAHAYRLNNQADKAAKAYKSSLKSEDPELRSVAWEQLGTLETKIQNYKQALTYYKRALVANPKNEQARYNYELLKKYLREHPEKQDQPKPAPQEKQDQQQQDQQPQPKDEQQQQQNQQEQPNPEGDQEKENPDQQQPGDQQQKPGQEPDQQNPEKQNQPKPGENGQEKQQPQGTEKGDQQGQQLADNEGQPEPPKSGKKAGTENATGNEQQLQTQYERLRKANISPEKAEMMLNAMRAAEQQYLQQLPKKGTKKRDTSKPDW